MFLWPKIKEMALLELDSLLTQIQQLNLPLIQEADLIVQAANLAANLICLRSLTMGSTKSQSHLESLVQLQVRQAEQESFFMGSRTCISQNTALMRYSNSKMTLMSGNYGLHCRMESKCLQAKLEGLINQYELHQNFNRLMLPV